jgi:hypothetical protein
MTIGAGQQHKVVNNDNNQQQQPTTTTKRVRKRSREGEGKSAAFPGIS